MKLFPGRASFSSQGKEVAAGLNPGIEGDYREHHQCANSRPDKIREKMIEQVQFIENNQDIHENRH
jgi:hypothetical protein